MNRTVFFFYSSSFSSPLTSFSQLELHSLLPLNNFHNVF